MIVLRAFLTILTIASTALAASSTGTAPADTLVDFVLDDQFETTHTDQDLRGQVAVVVWVDRKGNDHRPRWQRILERELAGAVASGAATITYVAHLDGVPGFVKGRVKDRFQEEETPVLMDWDGLFAARYEPVADQLNVLVFDADGRLRHEAAATKLDQDVLDGVLAAVR